MAQKQTSRNGANMKPQQCFPTFRYHKTEAPKKVESQEELDLLSEEEWKRSPADHVEQPKEEKPLILDTKDFVALNANGEIPEDGQAATQMGPPPEKKKSKKK
jgi:hypothetical protein